MSTNQKKEKAPVTPQVIYKWMLILVFAVAAVFFAKNVISMNVAAMVVIGICLVVFGVAVLTLKKAREGVKYATVSVMILILIFAISLFSGASYSDDFLLYMAAMGLCGMFLRPRITMVQLVAADVLLIVQALIHPEKAGAVSQYIMCIAIFTLAAVLMYQVIKRGRAYIAMSDDRTKEAESLVESLTTIGEEIHNNFKKSTETYEGLNIINEQLKETSEGLKAGSEGILAGTDEVVEVCDDMHEKILTTGNHINALNADVNHFETALSENHNHMEDMNRQMAYVQKSMQETGEVFRKLEQQMQQIVEVTEKLNKIASNTNMLALNASIEAARAGKLGEGFAVVAAKVQDLAVDSNRCSAEVAEVVNAMQDQIKNTTKEMAESEDAIQGSLEALSQLSEGCMQLTYGFASLYNNIAAQNDNVGAIDAKFDQLKEKIYEMSHYSQENQDAVVSITEAIAAYKDNMQKVINDSSHMSEISEEMLSTVIKK
ncbi:MAG: hypothetical protein IJ379_05700 [Lachnospiraceae bacterium]|nr:hypothetical protein [Lachnospiraceae bacterium]